MAAFTGAISSVGGTALQMTATSRPLIYGVWVRAAGANTNKVYVGLANTVTAGSADATDGYELGAGQETFIPVFVTTNANTLYVIAGASSQKVFFYGF